LSSPALTTVGLSPGVAEALLQVPATAGVGQVCGPDGRNLVLGTAANLRRWAAAHFGRGPKPKAGKRPKTDLSTIAESVRFVETRGAFQQRLVYERLMAPLVPLAKRRDLRPPAYLHLDPAERFPRISVAASEPVSPLFGPFRDRRAAEKARDSVQRLFPLRPCDHRFEPAEDLPLGIACLYAQVRSCAAPCLRRASEDEYRALAAQVVLWLGDPARRADAPAAVPATVGAAATARGLVVDPARDGVGLYPVLAGRVLDAAARTAALETLGEALASLEWTEADGPSDWPWLLAWLKSRKARACFLVVGDGGLPALEGPVRALVPVPAAARRGDKVGTTRRTS
jgi:hypothetical protein